MILTNLVGTLVCAFFLDLVYIQICIPCQIPAPFSHDKSNNYLGCGLLGCIRQYCKCSYKRTSASMHVTSPVATKFSLHCGVHFVPIVGYLSQVPYPSAFGIFCQSNSLHVCVCSLHSKASELHVPSIHFPRPDGTKFSSHRGVHFTPCASFARQSL